VPNCLTCSQVNGYDINCTVCMTGYFPNNATSCELCDSFIGNCSTCTPDYAGGANCTACINKYYTLNGSTCLPCVGIDANCYSCNNQAQCTRCLLGYYVNINHTCTEQPACDVENCYACQTADSNLCATCNTYFILSNDSASCEAPTECPVSG
jgi:hypothetical protein